MSGRYGSLYDSYRLSNSSVVPLYQGSAAPEALQVGQHMQQLYDMAKTGAGDVQSASDNLQYLQDSPDAALADEVRSKINGDISKMSDSRDWENQVDAVRGLGRYYANRARELATPVMQLQKYQEGLDDKELGLTPEQKQLLLARSKAGYKGLQKDGFGRFVGGFNGVQAAKNVDMPTWADNVMKNMKEFKGGEIVEFDNQKGYLVKNGSKREWVSPERVKTALQSAMAMDTNVQAFLNMEGENAKFLGSRVRPEMVPDKLSNGQPNPTKQEALNLAQATGQPFGAVYGELMKRAHTGNLVNSAMTYVQTKYAFDNRESSHEISVMDPYWRAQEQGANDPGVFGDLTTDVGVDLTKKYGDPDQIETSYNTALQNMDAANNTVNAARQTVARSLGKKADQLSDKEITTWYSKNDPAGLGKYKASVTALGASKSTIDEINALKTDAMDLAIKAKNPGHAGYKAMQQDATSQFQNTVKSDKLSFNLGKTKVDASNIGNYEVVDGDKSFGDPGNYIVLREKGTGKQYRIQTKGGMGHNEGFVDKSEPVDAYVSNESLRKIGGMFDGVSWKNTWKDAASNIRSNTMWMPLLNKTTPDGNMTKSGAYSTRVSGILRAGSGGLNVKDADLNDLGDAKDMRTLIGAGKFDLLGVGKVGSDGKLYAKLSVEVNKDAEDPQDRFKTIVVGVDSNMANKMGQYAQEAGMKFNDVRTYQFGKAMMPGSGYEQVLDLGSNGRLLIKDRPKITGQQNGKPVYSSDSKPLYEVVSNLTGDPSAAMSYEMYQLDDNGNRAGSTKTFTDAFDLGTYIDKLREAGAVTQKNNKR